MSEANVSGGETVAPWVVRLRYVVKDLGAPAVCESLGVTLEGLHSLVLGEAELEPGMEEMLSKLCQAFGQAIGAVEDLEDVIALSRGQTESDLDYEDAIQGPVSGVEGQPAGVSPDGGGMDASPLASGDGAGTGPGAELSADGVSAAGILGEGTGGAGVIMPGKRWSEDIEMRRRALWTARGVAVMSQFRLDLEYHEHVASLACVAQVELALISFFMESVPDPGEVWNPAKRAREIERRLRRIRWAEAGQREGAVPADGCGGRRDDGGDCGPGPGGACARRGDVVHRHGGSGSGVPWLTVSGVVLGVWAPFFTAPLLLGLAVEIVGFGGFLAPWGGLTRARVKYKKQSRWPVCPLFELCSKNSFHLGW